jgi:DNA-binding NarL/FixJ family response regulator
MHASQPGNVMEIPSKVPAMKSALWIEGSDEMLERTSAITRMMFSEITVTQLAELPSLNLSSLMPGYPIILEFKTAAKTVEWIEESIRIIQQVYAAAKPIILCVGHQVAAEVVVDWVRAGAFSYVERMADDRHMRQAFQSMAQEAATVQKQYLRYEKLMQLWNSITEREASVLGMLMEGLPNKKIANQLSVSQRTIEARRQKLYEKLESRSVVDVVRTIYELESLESIFHRIDSGDGANSGWKQRASRLLQRLPQLHSDVPQAHFDSENRDQIHLRLLSRPSEQ